MIQVQVKILSENWFVRNNKNVSENIFAEVYCPKFYSPKIFVLNVIFSKKNAQVVQIIKNKLRMI